MKKIALISVILVIAGLLLIVIGLLTGSKQGVYIDNKGIHVLADEEYEIKELNLEPFKNIDINMAYSNIEIIESNQYGIEVWEEFNIIKWSIQDETLKMDSERTESIQLFNLDFSSIVNAKEKVIKIYIPKDAEINDINIKMSTGNIKLNNFTAQNVNIESSYGNVNCNNINIENLDISMKTGNLRNRRKQHRKFCCRKQLWKYKIRQY